MPNYQGHLIGGIFAFGITIQITNYQKILIAQNHWPFMLAICLLGSLAPDIDIHSIGRKIWDGLVISGFITSIFFQKSKIALIFLSLFCFSRLAGHRRVTHNIFFITIIPYFLSVIMCKHLPGIAPFCSKTTYLFFVTGAISHLILDFLPTQYLPNFFYSKKIWRR